MIKLSTIKSNPNNPRVIKDDKFAKLVNSIKEFPKMMELRPMVVNSDMVVLGGNMRLKALKEAGYKEVPGEWVKSAESLTEEEQRRFIIADNVGFGEHDWDMLANEWDAVELEAWGLDMPSFAADNMTNNEDYEGLDQLSKLDKFLGAELKRLFLVYDNETFLNVVSWFEKKQKEFDLENNSDVILKIIENENI
jgi:ParB-like chromosome segregation protein Spo0J